METFAIELPAQKVSEAGVAAGHEHILVGDVLHLQAVSVQPDKNPQDHDGAADGQACVFPVTQKSSKKVQSSPDAFISYFFFGLTLKGRRQIAYPW